MDYDEFFDIMGNDVRRKILQNLARGPLSIGKLNALIDVSRQAILKHLKDLEERGFVETREADERDKKTGPNPHIYELKQLFTSLFDLDPSSFNPNILFLSIGDSEDINLDEAELEKPENIASIKPLIANLAELNKKLVEISKSYKEFFVKKNQILQELKSIFDSIVIEGEEREILNALLEQPEKAMNGFTLEEFADKFQIRLDFMKFILGNLVEAGILGRSPDGRYFVK
ncbi:MAG TPA: helix-turn-helix domain-containing protein [Candidatus Lokiarchaeia archaeon]|nr:helix-turn-helix domain-containing protein [Candidatus Lokiarchaeia archaeon]